MKRMKQVTAVLLSAALVAGMAGEAPKADAAKKVSLTPKSVTLKEKKTKQLKLKKGSKVVTSGVKWSSSNKKVATVSGKGKVTAKKAGKATVTAKYQKKSYTCKVTVKKASSGTDSTTTTDATKAPASASPVSSTQTPSVSGTPSASQDPSASENPAASGAPATTNGPEVTQVPSTSTAPASDFSFKDDVSIEYGSKDIYVEFEINKETTSEEELRELGYDVKDGTASITTACETATYTFKKLPSTLADIESFFNEPEDEKYGGFNAMAASICAACTFKGGSNPSDPFFSNDPVRDMFEYINGPAASMDISKTQMDNAINSMKAAIQSCGENVYKSYFNGATPKNNYTPDEPYVLEMYKGPYYIPEKQTINGTRPTTYMIFAKSGGAETERYIDVYYSTKMERWYSYENQFMHVIANDFQAPEEEL